MARIRATSTTGKSTGSGVRPSESISISKIRGGGAGPAPSMNTPGDGGVRRALAAKDRRTVDEHARDDRSARHFADAMSPIGGPADPHGTDE